MDLLYTIKMEVIRIKFEGREITALAITETGDKTIWVLHSNQGPFGNTKQQSHIPI